MNLLNSMARELNEGASPKESSWYTRCTRCKGPLLEGEFFDHPGENGVCIDCFEQLDREDIDFAGYIMVDGFTITKAEDAVTFKAVSEDQQYAFFCKTVREARATIGWFHKMRETVKEGIDEVVSVSPAKEHPIDTREGTEGKESVGTLLATLQNETAKLLNLTERTQLKVRVIATGAPIPDLNYTYQCVEVDYDPGAVIGYGRSHDAAMRAFIDEYALVRDLDPGQIELTIVAN